LRSFGANIVVEPKIEGIAQLSEQKRYLRESDMIKIKTIFWRHNILGFVPFLEGKVSFETGEGDRDVSMIGTWYEKEMPIPGDDQEFSTGLINVSPWWSVEGKWPEKMDEVLVGVSLADTQSVKRGDTVILNGRNYFVTGTLSTGSVEDNSMVGELSSVQNLLNLDGRVSRVMVSALTTPMDEFAYKNPDTMTQAEYEKWYCTGYVTSIAKQVEEVFPGGKAKPIWPVAETEGKVLKKLSSLIYLLSLFTLLASSLGVSTAMIMSLLRRTEEIALMKALGADTVKIVSIFFTEASLIGMIGGVLGLTASYFFTDYIGIEVFGVALAKRGLLFPTSLGLALFISLLGTILPIQKALRIRPAIVLKGGGI
jgi:putative ABC transport system permease protein